MKAILVDDEQLTLDLLESKLTKISNINIMGKYVNPIVAKKEIIQQAVDVVFLDIHMPVVNGLKLAKQILQSKPNLSIVFVTTSDVHALEAFELGAIDYIVKPIQIDRLEKTVKRIKANDRTKLYNDSSENNIVYVDVSLYLSIRRKGEKKESISWRTAKAQELFLFLLHHRGQLVRKSYLVELLWPEVNPSRAFSQLYTTIYHVRKILNEFRYHFTIINKTDGYILSTENVVIDVEEWKNRLVTAPPLNSQTIDTYEDIMKIYKGPYLKEYNYWWVEMDQYRWEQLWLDRALKIADYFCLQGDMSEAQRWYTRILKQHPESEEAHFSLMKIYAAEDNHVYVYKQYLTLKDLLQEELEVQPRIEIIEWFTQWRKSNNQLI